MKDSLISKFWDLRLFIRFRDDKHYEDRQFQVLEFHKVKKFKYKENICIAERNKVTQNIKTYLPGRCKLLCKGKIQNEKYKLYFYGYKPGHHCDILILYKLKQDIRCKHKKLKYVPIELAFAKFRCDSFNIFLYDVNHTEEIIPGIIKQNYRSIFGHENCESFEDQLVFNFFSGFDTTRRFLNFKS